MHNNINRYTQSLIEAKNDLICPIYRVTDIDKCTISCFRGQKGRAYANVRTGLGLPTRTQFRIFSSVSIFSEAKEANKCQTKTINNLRLSAFLKDLLKKSPAEWRGIIGIVVDEEFVYS